jgi:hypothetical protein
LKRDRRRGKKSHHREEERGKRSKEVENLPNEAIPSPPITREYGDDDGQEGRGRSAICQTLENFGWSQACDMYVAFPFSLCESLPLSDRSERRSPSKCAGFLGLRGSCPNPRDRGQTSRAEEDPEGGPGWASASYHYWTPWSPSGDSACWYWLCCFCLCSRPGGKARQAL